MLDLMNLLLKQWVEPFASRISNHSSKENSVPNCHIPKSQYLSNLDGSSKISPNICPTTPITPFRDRNIPFVDDSQSEVRSLNQSFFTPMISTIKSGWVF